MVEPCIPYPRLRPQGVTELYETPPSTKGVPLVNNRPSDKKLSWSFLSVS
jgi:hypothetical protein